ncbi:M domain protein [Clostridium vincentii]|uniref:M domain protein n=1 Tax=Clostridium vincentii TaxID=52704 RepID=A0A2T0B5R5_9CLOT|nr:M domain protein [Clostridium vincentii]PRR79216.1 hypothetical protein CLVI_33980 [Clostridium vincentii]
MDNETKKMFEILINKLDNIDGRLTGMDERLTGIETRQDEIFSVVNAIEHSSTTHKAEIDNMTHKIAHTEGIINKIGNVITERSA